MAVTIIARDGKGYSIPEDLLPQALAAGCIPVTAVVAAPAAEPPQPLGAGDSPPAVSPESSEPPAPEGARLSGAINSLATATPAWDGAFMLPRPGPHTQASSDCQGCGKPFTPLPDESRVYCRPCVKLGRGR